jgi:WD40 repeat protein
MSVTTSTRFEWAMAAMAGLGTIGTWLARWAFLPGQPEGSGSIGIVLTFTAATAIVALLVVAAFTGRRAARSLRSSVPAGYGLSLVGFGLIGIGLILDPPIRALFGDPVSLEGLVWIPQLLITAGAVLVVTGPVRSTSRRAAELPNTRHRTVSSWIDRGPAVVVVAFALVLLTPVDWMHPAGEAWWMPAPADPAAGDPRNELFAMHADGSRQTRLVTHPSVSIYAPAWSPDGSRIAYQLSPGAAEGSAGDLHVANADGSDPIPLSPRSDSPSWSPDGSRVVFHSDRDEVGNQDIHIVDADGSNIRRLTTEPAFDLIPMWSPDGDRIAFNTDRSGRTEVWVMNVDGSDQHRLIDGGDSFVGSWSPDGMRIAFASNRDGDYEVYTADATGSDITQVTDSDDSDYDPRWSPDGDRLLFVSFRDGEAELYVVEVEGGEPTNISRNATMDERAGATWSPDGAQILYSAHGYPPVETVAFIRADLGVATVLVWSAVLAIVGLLIVSVGHPLGAFTLVLTIHAALVAAPHGNLRFLPAAVAAGLIVDVVLFVAVKRHRPRATALLAAALVPAASFACYFVTLAILDLLDWSAHLWIGSIALATMIGLLLGWIVTWWDDPRRARPAPGRSDPGGA